MAFAWLCYLGIRYATDKANIKLEQLQLSSSKKTFQIWMHKGADGEAGLSGRPRKVKMVAQKHIHSQHRSFQKWNWGGAERNKQGSPDTQPKPVASAVRYRPVHSWRTWRLYWKNGLLDFSYLSTTVRSSSDSAAETHWSRPACHVDLGYHWWLMLNIRLLPSSTICEEKRRAYVIRHARESKHFLKSQSPRADL